MGEGEISECGSEHGRFVRDFQGGAIFAVGCPSRKAENNAQRIRSEGMINVH